MVNKEQRPLLQLEFLISTCMQGGGSPWVLDACCGSGSGVVAALRMGYNAAGFDIAKDQVEATKARVRFFLEREVKLLAKKYKFVVPFKLSLKVCLIQSNIMVMTSRVMTLCILLIRGSTIAMSQIL